jgi:hypothetical protein
MKARKHEYDNLSKDPGIQYKKRNNNRKYHTVGLFSRPHRQIIEPHKIDSSNMHIHDS